MRVTDIDPNFSLSDSLPEQTRFWNFRSVWEEPFRIYGIANNETGHLAPCERNGMEPLLRSILYP